MKLQRVQFSLRTLFAGMLVVAAATAWYARPRPHYEPLAGGWRIALPPGRNNGPFLILDEHDRVVCRGELAQACATGTWTYFHENGRVAFSGAAEKIQIGTWTAWSEKGRRAAEFQFTEPREWTDRPTILGAALVRPMDVYLPSFRGRTWRHDGRSESNREDSRRAAETWTLDDANGGRAEVTVHNGRRYGPVRVTNASGKSFETNFYADRPLPVCDDSQLAAWAQRLKSPSLRERRAAMEVLVAAGTPGFRQLVSGLRSPHADVVEGVLWHLELLRPFAAGSFATGRGELERLAATDPQRELRARGLLLDLDDDQRARRWDEFLECLSRQGDLDHEIQNRVHYLVHDHWQDAAVLRQLDAADPAQRITAAIILGWRYGLQRPAEPTASVLRRALDHSDPHVAHHVRELAERYTSQFQRPWLP